MSSIVNNHWLSNVRHLQSPNCDVRANENDISLIVIHCISLPPRQFGTVYIDQLFTNCLDPDEHSYFKAIHKLKVSSHILINRNGEITQYVPFNLRAWHAGQSSYYGRACCNDFSIGIELEGTETELYTDQQYNQLVDVVIILLKNYTNLSADHITGHSDIAPGRKEDPGSGFDWSRFHCLLATKTQIVS
ncbi:MAG: 1,6-anhydro-N-acetylmuramyl-L-alanine amidase AmpD [Methylococcales bacterium]